jgi:hypothetical protein
MKEVNKTYTAADFNCYHEGTMPANEMHALEKAALEDPFLADALEGYKYAPAAESDVSELNERLMAKRKKKSIFFLSSVNRWWRIAALFIIIGGAGYLLFQKNDVRENNILAKNEKESFVEKKDSASSDKPNNAISSSDSFNNNQLAKVLPGKKKLNSLPTMPSLKKGYSYSEKDAESLGFTSLNKSTADSSYVTAEGLMQNNQTGKQAPAKYMLKGKVVDEVGTPLGYASVTDKQHNRNTVADSTGNFELASQDSTTIASASLPGFDTKSFNLKNNKDTTIVLDKTDVSLAEVVVTGYGSKRKQSITGPTILKGKVSGVQVMSDELEPEGGLEELDEYIADNKVQIHDEKGNMLSGEITLSFAVDNKGKPENIKVIKSSCSPCEAEARRLLQNGPQWKTKKGDKGKVVIKF